MWLFWGQSQNSKHAYKGNPTSRPTNTHNMPISVNDIIIAAIERRESHGQVVSTRRPIIPAPSLEFATAMQQYECSTRRVKRKTKVGDATSTRLLKKPAPFSGALAGFQACRCSKRGCDVKDGIFGDEFWDAAVASYRAAEDSDAWLRNWILGGRYDRSMCKRGIAIMLRIGLRIVDRCWPTPIQAKVAWQERDMPQQCCVGRTCLATMGLVRARKMRSSFEQQDTAGKWLAASQLVEETSNSKFGFKYCTVAMKALTGLGSNTLHSIARGKPAPTPRRHYDKEGPQILPKEIKTSIIAHALQNGENSNTSGRVYVPDAIGGQRVGSKRKMHAHWQSTVASGLPEGYAVSKRYWQDAITEHGIDLQRRKAGTDFCDECIEMRAKIAADPSNRELVEQLDRHLEAAAAEKAVYRADLASAQEQIRAMDKATYRRLAGDVIVGGPVQWLTQDMELHLALDMGASWHYPRFASQPKSLYMAQRADVFVSVCANMGTGHKLVMLWDETMGKKDANKTVNALDFAIRRLCIGEHCICTWFVPESRIFR